MLSEFYLYSVLLVIVISILDRLREASSFWFDQSIFMGLPQKIRDWFDPRDELEMRYISFLKFKIPLHPIFWDGYHFAKNMSVLAVLMFLGIVIHWTLIFLGALIWYIFQFLAYRWFVKEEFEDYNG